MSTTISQLNSCIEVRTDLPDYNNGRKALQVLCISDLHVESHKARTKLLKTHLDQAKNSGSLVFMFGDILDLMGHDRDPRSGKSDIPKALAETDYFDRVEEFASQFFEPYRENIVLMANGNHEENVIKRHSTDILKRVVKNLGSSIIYSFKMDGWIRFVFQCNGASNRKCELFWNHFNTGGMVTKGMIGTNRRASQIKADIFVTGHIHTKFTLPDTRIQLNSTGKEVERKVLHIQLPSYKKAGAWERSKQFYASAKGGYWIEFSFFDNKLCYRAVETLP